MILSAQSRRLDSLRSVVESPTFAQKPDSFKSQAYTLLSYEYSNWSMYDKAIPLADSALRYARATKNHLRIIKATNLLGMCYAFTADFERSLRLQLQALDMSLKYGENAEAVIEYGNLALFYMQVKQVDKAILYIHKSQHEFDKLDSGQKNSLQAAASSTMLLNDQYLGLLYAYQRQFDSAFFFVRRAEKADRENIKLPAEAHEYNRLYQTSFLAMIFALQPKLPHNTDSSLHYSAIAERLGKSNLDPYIASILYRAAGMAHAQRKNYPQAEKYLRQSCDAALKAQAPQERLESLEEFANVCRAQRKFENALQCLDTASNLRNTLFSNQSIAHFAEEQYTVEKNATAQQISVLAHENDVAALWRKVLMGASLLLVVMVLVIVNRYRLKQRSEAVLKEINEKLSDANEELTVLNAEKNEFLGIAAHDLKNPLANIRLLAELSKRQTAPNTVQNLAPATVQNLHEYSAGILKSADGMIALVKNLLDVNALEQGGMRLLKETVAPAPLVENVCKLYEERAAAKGMRLHCAIAESLHYCTIEADSQALMQVLDNLVSNAVKYTPQGGKVWVNVQEKSGKCQVLVRDSGAGISKKDQEQLFGKFVRLSARPTGDETSTGLGLSIVKRLVEAMNGRVWCESELGSGATFVVEFKCL